MEPRTEDEAAKIVCHKTIIGSKGLQHNCIGSKCMAWDWLAPRRGTEIARVLTAALRTGNLHDWVRRADPGHDETYYVRYEQIPVGDCGLKASMAPELNCGAG